MTEPAPEPQPRSRPRLRSLPRVRRRSSVVARRQDPRPAALRPLRSLVGVGLIALAAATALGTACARDDTDRIRSEAELLAHEERGDAVRDGAERLARFGRRAVPAIEAALHNAPPRGRKNLVLALRRLGDEESVPLLRHRALYDDDPEVRREAEWTLRQWAAGTGPRADRARAAVREVEEGRAREETG